MWRIFWHIWMPLSRATIAAVGIFTFVHAWNNFLWPFVVTSAGSLLRSRSVWPPCRPPTARSTRSSWRSPSSAALPLLIAFVLFQRQIVQGIANTGLKG